MQTENIFLKLLSKAIVGSFETIEIIKSEIETHCKFKNERKLNSINLIFPALYGPFHDLDGKNSHVMASLISRFIKCKSLNSKSVTCWGNGKPIREFIYVDDAVDAILLATKKYNKIEPLNIGEGKGYTVKQLAKIIKELTSYKGKIVWDKSKPNGVMKKILDTTKMKKVLNWEPKIKLRDGINLTIKWYMNSKIK